MRQITQAVKALREMNLRVRYQRGQLGIGNHADWERPLTRPQLELVSTHGGTLSELAENTSSPLPLYNDIGFDIEVLVDDDDQLVLDLFDRRVFAIVQNLPVPALTGSVHRLILHSEPTVRLEHASDPFDPVAGLDDEVPS